ncbi:MAG: DUF3604 domain-containing protein [Candidatus Pelagadaptatus aseana]|uniref:DUF3604 domain-containing protein n=1 Tax=Candidatus Pelagadaptatus aseana TaxID=3120508 RepID=UPI0039B1AEEB
MRTLSRKRLLSVVAALAGVCSVIGSVYAQTNLYWGDTHLHTKLSPDAYMMGNRSLSPDDAYRFAKGLPVVNAKTRHKIQIKTPLDFLVVSDHAEYMGVVSRMLEGDPELLKTATGKRFSELTQQGLGRKAFLEMVASANSGKPLDEINTPEIRGSVWESIYNAADQHNEPGKFTALVGWEWSSITYGANLHRVIFQKQGAEAASQYLPFSLFDSDRPEDLWDWLEQTEEKSGANFIAIPHNGNVSKGKMFSEVDSRGKPIDAGYAKMRMRWEPVYEMTQIKGDGETLADLSPADEFAEFESYRHPMDARIGVEMDKAPANKGDYARTALMRGMEIEARAGVNPYKFGMIGASDSHSGVSAVEEDNFGGKFPVDSYPEGKSSQLTPGVIGYDMASAGLAGVWAGENTREAIFDAFKRREVYGTTGPRIRLRLFAGWDFTAEDTLAKDIGQLGYRKGVPMGADLSMAPDGIAPSFLIQAVKDPIDANLDRIQVVKGWLDAKGRSHEKVFNVAASDNRPIENNQLAPVGNTVDLKTASYTNSIGSPELVSVWQDPEFNPAVRAFYYVRVLQIPTPRHSLYATVAMNKPHPKGHPATIQERAYSSPIWYTP